jgi:hypothetical protein
LNSSKWVDLAFKIVRFSLSEPNNFKKAN